MEAVPPEVLRHYEADIDEAARITTGFRQLELVRTQEVLRRHLAPGSRILDVGGGPGTHARWLAADGHAVHVVDPVPRHVDQAAAIDGVTAALGDARRLTEADASFDAVLLLGPLYHLVQRDERVAAWREAARVVRPGGVVIAAAVSRFASLFDGLAQDALFDGAFRAIVEQDLATGHHANPDNRPGWFTTAYFHHPDELPEEAADAGLDVVELVGVEGLAVFLARLAPRWDDPADRDTILWAARVIESEPALRGLSPHLLLVARGSGSWPRSP